MQNGFRNGLWTDLMKPVVAKLTPDDMIAHRRLRDLRRLRAELSRRRVRAIAFGRASAAQPPRHASWPRTRCSHRHRQSPLQRLRLRRLPRHERRRNGPGSGPDRHAPGRKQIAKFLNKPSADAKAKGMPDIPPTSPDLQPLVAYVLSLKKPN